MFVKAVEEASQIGQLAEEPNRACPCRLRQQIKPIFYMRRPSRTAVRAVIYLGLPLQAYITSPYLCPGILSDRVVDITAASGCSPRLGIACPDFLSWGCVLKPEFKTRLGIGQV